MTRRDYLELMGAAAAASALATPASAARAHTMTPDEVLAVAKEGEKLGCTEALFSLGDRPEAIFPEMRETLKRLGYRSTLHYLEAMCEMVLRETTAAPTRQSRAAERQLD